MEVFQLEVLCRNSSEEDICIHYSYTNVLTCQFLRGNDPSVLRHLLNNLLDLRLCNFKKCQRSAINKANDWAPEHLKVFCWFSHAEGLKFCL